MPITLTTSRRQFLAGALAAGVGLSFRRLAWALPTGADAHRLALLSDMHIDADPSKIDRGINIADHLRRAVEMVLDPAVALPSAVIVSGDCAHTSGPLVEYRKFLELIDPLLRAKLPVHITLGNHDQRDNFRQTLPDQPFSASARIQALPSHQVLAVETPRAHWILLDTLEKTLQTPGFLGEKQLAWLAGYLDGLDNKPVLIVMHHNPLRQPKPSSTTKPVGTFMGLRDSDKLFDVVLPRKKVKALLFGHTHEWRITTEQDLHLINLPAVSYVFKKSEPSGWVDCHLAENGAELTLRTVAAHPRDKELLKLNWR